MRGMAPSSIDGGHGNNRVQQKNTSYLYRIYDEKMAIATECGLWGGGGVPEIKMMGLGV